MAMSAFGLKGWIDENRHLLQSSAPNKQVFEDADFIVFIVGGPNKRKDYHINPTEELVYQLEGDITIKVIEDGKKRDIPIHEGDVFLLPPNIPHSPQRPANTVGIVVERWRPVGQEDQLRFYCEKCDNILFNPQFYLTEIAEVQALMDQFWADESLRTCKKCGTVMQPPQAAS